MDLMQQLINEVVNEKTKVVEWPTEFINKDTGRKFVPHRQEHLDWILNDEPRYLLAKGGEGCVDPNTLINGIPIADWQGGLVDTLYGKNQATKSYLKGKADLYRVKTKLGREVICTLEHKFLTGRGWNELSQLKIGDQISVKNKNAYVFDEIVTITHHHFGDYYDLSVPIVEHYEANGILHHNSGKSVLLVMKILYKLRRGMSGIVVSPTLPAFKRAFFPELLRWLPKELVIEPHQRYFSPAWSPHTSFNIVVYNELGGFSTLTCASAENPVTLEGPNLNFCAAEEIRGIPKPDVVEILSGRIRINGPKGEPPQMFISSSPRMHWMFDMFGPEKPKDEIDKYRELKQQSWVITLSTKDNINAGNIDEDYYGSRGATLSEAQKRVLLEGQWDDEDNPNNFLENMAMWDSLATNLPSLKPKNSPDREYHDNLVIGVDGAVTRDHFAIVGVSRSPFNREETAVRLVKVWKPDGQKINFEEVENYIRDIAKRFNVITIVYDPSQLHGMMQKLNRDGVAWCQEFTQNSKRSLADQMLYDMILRRQIVHDGDEVLREYIRNSDSKFDAEFRQRRIVKRTEDQKIDAAVALSQANYETIRLSL